MAGGNNDNGFIQRFQLAVFPDHKEKLHIVDRKPDLDAQNEVFELIKQIAAWPVPKAMEDVPGLHFSPDQSEDAPRLNIMSIRN